MTPAARLSAAIDILDAVLDGAPAEKQLTTWGRQNRYAGSKDRAAIRDLVFQALRCKRSHAALGGGMTGRGLVLGGLREAGTDPDSLFTGARFAPAPLSEVERAYDPGKIAETQALDCPEWLAPALRDSLGNDFAAILALLRQRAPVFVRVNLRKAEVGAVQAALAEDGIETVPHKLSPTALEVTANARRLQQTRAYAEGWIELQDAGSQAITDRLPVNPGDRVLDFCAGGGGKTLALAGRVQAQFDAYDAAPQRLRDLPARAARAGVQVDCLTRKQLEEKRYDLVLCDVPCSGSGAWRRSPEGKWRLTQHELERIQGLQAQILDDVANLVLHGGYLAYATCALLQQENEAQIGAFLSRNTEYGLIEQHRLTPLDGGDGFFVAVLKRK